MLNQFPLNTVTLNSFTVLRSRKGGVVYLGRFQRGDKVPISVTLPAWPNSVPLLTVGNGVAVYEMPWTGQGFTFGFPLRISGLIGSLPLGSVDLFVHYAVGTLAGNLFYRFDLVDGGDSGGEVISMFCLERPEMTYVVAQLGAGMLVQGRNPHL